MRISGSHPSPPLPPNPAGRDAGRAEDAAAVTAPAPAPAETAEAPAPEAPAEEKAHGLVGAADHSHRSDVAALRQWINHPELRGDLALPDLAAEHHGNGFHQAVAAYEAVIALADPAPAADTPAVVDPVPVTDPAPVTADPAPVTDPALLPDPTSVNDV
jgi:hypothetical protein